LRSAISISMPGSAYWPSTSTTLPIGCACLEGCATSSTVATCPGLPRPGLVGRDQDVDRHAPVLRHEQQHAVRLVQAADDAPAAAREHLDDLAGGPAARVRADHAHAGPVAVQHLAHLGGGQQDPRRAVVGHEEAVALGMALDAPFGDGGGTMLEPRPGPWRAPRR